MIKAMALKVVEPNVSKEESNIKRYGKMELISYDTEKYSPAIEEISMKMVYMHKQIKEMLNQIRNNMFAKKSDFHFSLEENTEEERRKILELFQAMQGVICDYYYNENTYIFSGNVSLSNKAINFLNGKYMEIAIGRLTDNILQILSVKYHQEYAIKRNVVVSDGISRNEFDLMIEFGKNIYVVEIKSGKNFRDYYKYYYLGKRYGVVPDRILLVNSYLEQAQTELIEYFCEYYVSTLENYGDKLTEMLLKGMEEQRDGNNEME